MTADGKISFAGISVAAPFKPGALAAGSRLSVGLRPEHFDRETKSDGTVDVAIDFVEHLGGTSFVHGHIATGDKVIVEHRSAGSISTGGTLRASFRAEDLRVFDEAGARVR